MVLVSPAGPDPMSVPVLKGKELRQALQLLGAHYVAGHSIKDKKGRVLALGDQPRAVKAEGIAAPRVLVDHYEDVTALGKQAPNHGVIFNSFSYDYKETSDKDAPRTQLCVSTLSAHDDDDDDDIIVGLQRQQLTSRRRNYNTQNDSATDDTQSSTTVSTSGLPTMGNEKSLYRRPPLLIKTLTGFNHKSSYPKNRKQARGGGILGGFFKSPKPKAKPTVRQQPPKQQPRLPPAMPKAHPVRQVKSTMKVIPPRRTAPQQPKSTMKVIPPRRTVPQQQQKTIKVVPRRPVQKVPKKRVTKVQPRRAAQLGPDDGDYEC